MTCVECGGSAVTVELADGGQLHRRCADCGGAVIDREAPPKSAERAQSAPATKPAPSSAPPLTSVVSMLESKLAELDARVAELKHCEAEAELIRRMLAAANPKRRTR